MRETKRTLALIFSLVMLVGCIFDPATVYVGAKAKPPVLNKKKITTNVGKTSKVKVKRAAGYKIKWKSKNKKIAKVKKSGKYAAKITARKLGTTKVIATVYKGGRKKGALKCRVIVEKAEDSDDSSSKKSAKPAASANGEVTVPPSSGDTDTSQAPVTTDDTGASQAPVTTDDTGASQAPVTTEDTGTSQAPVTTEAPGTSQAPADPENVVAGSTVKGSSSNITATVNEEGAVADFNEASQYQEAKYSLAAPFSLSNVKSVQFTLNVTGEPNSVSFKLYDADGNELSSITQYNKGTGTHSVDIPDEYKSKSAAGFGIMTNSDIKDTTQTARAVLTNLKFVSGGASGTSSVPAASLAPSAAAASQNPSKSSAPSTAPTIPENAVEGSTVGYVRGEITAEVNSEGAVADFKGASQYQEAQYNLSVPVPLSNVKSVQFTLNVTGEPNSVTFKLYDSENQELQKMTKYNHPTGTYSVDVPDEYKSKTAVIFGIMTNTEIADTTQTAKAVLSDLKFVYETAATSAAPAATSKAPATPKPPTPVPSGKEVKLALSADTCLTSASLDGSPVYNSDGSVTFTVTQEYGGGGLAFALDESKSNVDLNDYEKVIFTVSADADAPACFNYHTSDSFWGGAAQTLVYGGVTTEKSDVSCNLSEVSGAVGFSVKYNTYGKEPNEIPEKLQITIHSITLIRDLRDATDAMTNYSSLAELAASYGLKIGTVINPGGIADKKYSDLMKYHFNSMTASNEMKAYSMLDGGKSKESYVDENSMPAINFTNADKVMDFAKANGIKIRGHVLVWDADMCDWFFRVGYDPSKGYASEGIIKKRTKNYIEQVLTHFEQKYPGIIYCWDVVNEAVGDSSSDYAAGDKRHVRTKRGENTNLFYDHMGSDYVELAFKYVHEVVEAKKAEYPSLGNIKWFYNDYNTFFADKRDAICELIKSINSTLSDGKGGYVKLCDGMGMQSYLGGYGTQDGCMGEWIIGSVDTAIEQYGELGIEVQATELAVRNYQNDEETFATHADFYEKLFRVYLKHAGEGKPLTAVSIWGNIDMPDLPETDYSFKMNGPFCGLFDENLAVKPAFVKVHNLLKG